MQEMHTAISKPFLYSLCDKVRKNNSIDHDSYESFNVKRGLRNPDGTGVMVGVTRIGNVHGYVMSDGKRVPVDGKLFYRGISVEDIIEGITLEGRHGFEEVAYLLLLGELPSEKELADFCGILSAARQLPEGFTDDILFKIPSRNIMNTLGRACLALYSYDDNPEDNSIENLLRQSIELISRFPTIVAHAYSVKKYYYEKESLHLHFPDENLSTAENFLRTIRPDSKYTREEAQMLDLCLILHAEHGGGTNSVFVDRAMTSTGTDTYAAISAAIGSLKGPKHGGANLKIVEMLDEISRNVKDHKDDEEVYNYLKKILNKEAGDGSGLIYGMGHAVYTKSDPRAIILKEYGRRLARQKGVEDDFLLIDSVERMAQKAFNSAKGGDKVIAANVDMYSGFVYRMLGIPDELFTPLFAISRIVGFCAHRIEEALTGGRIMRPAYKDIGEERPYVPLCSR